MTTPPILNYCSIPELPWLARWLMRPLGWPFFLLATAACLWMFWECRTSSRNWTEAAIGFLILAIIWIFRAGIRALLFAIYRLSWIEHWQKFTTFSIALCIPVLMVILILTHVPERLAFHISKNALQRFADSTLSGTRPSTPTTAGCLPIEEISVSQGSNTIIYFKVDDRERWKISMAGFYYRDGEGYAYAVNPITPEDEDFGRDYQHIHGHWYRVNSWRLRDLLR